MVQKSQTTTNSSIEFFQHFGGREDCPVAGLGLGLLGVRVATI